MGNLLTSGLLAAAIVAAVNVASGADAVSWAMFAAAAFAFLLGLDSGDSRVAGGSPLGHSVAGAAASAYLAGVLAYAGTAFLGIGAADALGLVLAVAAGYAAHLLAELGSGRSVFTFPNSLDPFLWFEERKPGRFWAGWGRISSGGRRLGDVHINAFSAALVLACIWLSGR